MEFRVFSDRDLYHVPQGFLEAIPGYMIFNEPAIVNWPEMVVNLVDQGYRSSSDLYFIKPGSVPPTGMVSISSQEDVDRMLQLLNGRQKCDLYIVKNYESSEDSYGDDDMGGHGMTEEYENTSWMDLDLDLEMDLDESSPRTTEPAINNPKKALNFRGHDEHKSE